MIMSIEIILSTVGGALLWSLSRYFKNNAENWDSFEAKRLVVPLLLGAGVGVSSLYLGVGYSETELVMLSYGLVAFIESIGKAIIAKYMAY